jgi:hypothetical protein
VHGPNFTTWTCTEQADIFRTLIRRAIAYGSHKCHPGAPAMQIAWHIARHGSPIIFAHLEMNSASQKISKILVFEKALQMAYLGAEGQILTVTHR